MTTQQPSVVLYKGKSYRLLWAGHTKFGRRAKLEFMDGGKEFWVDEALTKPEANLPKSHQTGDTCAECGRGGSLVQDCEDGMMKHYNCCDIPPSR